MAKEKTERRDFIKRAAYAVPVILSLKALPAFAASGSGAAKSYKESKSSRRNRESNDNNGWTPGCWPAGDTERWSPPRLNAEPFTSTAFARRGFKRAPAAAFSSGLRSSHHLRMSRSLRCFAQGLRRDASSQRCCQ